MRGKKEEGVITFTGLSSSRGDKVVGPALADVATTQGVRSRVARGVTVVAIEGLHAPVAVVKGRLARVIHGAGVVAPLATLSLVGCYPPRGLALAGVLPARARQLETTVAVVFPGEAGVAVLARVRALYKTKTNCSCDFK